MRPLVLAAFLIVPPLLIEPLGTARATAFDALARGAPAGASPAGQCRAAIADAERSDGVPDRLMQSIGIIESGRRDETGVVSPYPWTINAQGVGSFYATKAEAIAAVTALRARGITSIDVGCMQVNLMHHASAFASLDEAFDPAANAHYAAHFLTRLLAQTGSWPGATAGYHSLTPGIGDDYARKVLAIWGRPAAPLAVAGITPSARPVPPATTSSATAGSASNSFAAAGAANARVIPMPSTGMPSTGTPVVGRGLASYRAAPTRLAFGAIPGRG